MDKRLIGLPLLAVLLWAAAPAPAAAQQGLDDWRTMANGDEIITVAVDPRDRTLVWSGTEGGGLVVWDLTVARDAPDRFRQYLFPNQPGLRSNDVRDIAFDLTGPLGTAWLATGAGVTRAGHPAGGDWTTYGRDAGLPSSDITAVAVGPDGTLWAGTRDSGVAELPPGATTFETYAVNEDEPELGPGVNGIADIVVGDDGRVYVAHGRFDIDQPALSVFDPTLGIWERIESVGPGGDPTAGPATSNIMALDGDETGLLWLAGWSEGVLTYDPAADAWDQMDAATTEGLCPANVWAVTADMGVVWAACGDSTSGEGASWYDGGTWTLWTRGDGLPTDVVTDIAVVTADEAYLATNGPGDRASGLVPFVGAAVEPALRTAPQTPWSNDLTAVLIDDTGVVWVGTRESGLMAYDGQTWRRYTYDGTGGGLRSDAVTDLALGDGRLWVASTSYGVVEDGRYVDGGVSALDLATGEWVYAFDSATSDLPDNDVSSVVVDPVDGRVWIGTGTPADSAGASSNSFTGQGIAIFDPRSGLWDRYTSADTGGELTGDTVLGLAAGPADELWAATAYTSNADVRRAGGGVSQFAGGAWTGWTDGAAGFRTYSVEGGAEVPDGLISGDVRSVAVDGAGRAWAGTWDLGAGNLSSVWPFVTAVVNRYNGVDWSHQAFPGDGWVSALAEDSRGRVWAATTRGHLSEYWPGGTDGADTARGGIHVFLGGDGPLEETADWLALRPVGVDPDTPPSGVASNAVTDLLLDEVTGDMWVVTQRNGLSVYTAGQPQPTATPCVDCPTATPRPTSTPRPPATDTPDVPPVYTLPPNPTSAPGGATATASPVPPDDDDDEPQPPPEVPEASTMAMFALGLAVIGLWWMWRQRATVGV